MAETGSQHPDQVRTAELMASLSLSTDLAMGFPLEHGLRSTQIAMRLCDHMAVDTEVARDTYYLSLLFYIGCNAPVDVGWEVFGEDDSLTRYGTPFRFGTKAEGLRGFARAVAPPSGTLPVRVWRLARHLPVLMSGYPEVVAATCEVARMLSEPLGLGSSVARSFESESERWDGGGMPNGVSAEEIPIAMRLVHVARDAALQEMIGGVDFAAEVLSGRSGAAFDPHITTAFNRGREDILRTVPGKSIWRAVILLEPHPWLSLEGDEIDGAMAAMGHFADMSIPDLIGHSGGVAGICRRVAALLPMSGDEQATVRRAALIHDLGRVAVPARIWSKSGPLSLDEWERVRLHAYQTERLMAQSPFLARLIPAATMHHERLDGSGYHRGAEAGSIPLVGRLVAVADAYHAMTEPRPHRPALESGRAAGVLADEARAGRLDPDIVAVVLDATGHDAAPVERPAGLTSREVEVVALLARGLQTKQIARSLQISPKTADSHIQNAYRKMNVSTRAGATVFAMQHGLVTWENSR